MDEWSYGDKLDRLAVDHRIFEASRLQSNKADLIGTGEVLSDPTGQRQYSFSHKGFENESNKKTISFGGRLQLGVQTILHHQSRARCAQQPWGFQRRLTAKKSQLR